MPGDFIHPPPERSPTTITLHLARASACASGRKVSFGFAREAEGRPLQKPFQQPKFLRLALLVRGFAEWMESRVPLSLFLHLEQD
jgi:hypothetical protein